MAARTKVFVDIITKSGGKAPGSGLKKFAIQAGAATAALVILVKVGKEWSKAASDAEEIGSKFATIFRDIGKESETLADKFAEDFGLASSSSKELLGNTADLLTGFGLTQQAALDMSIATNELAADLASFSNAQGGAEAVSKALTAAYSGERESLKTYGIIINEAMVKAQLYKQAQEGLTFASERQAKIAATLTLAIEQSGNAIGDVARTFNSHANVTRRLEQSTKSFKEEMGKMVNKAATPMLIVTDKLIKSMAEWLNKTNELNDAIEQFENGTADGEQSVKALNNELINQVVQMAALNDAVNLNIAGSEAAVEAQKKRIEQTQILIGVAARSAALEAQGAALSAETAKQKAKDDQVAEASAKAVEERIKALNEAYDGTIEGQIKSTEAQIAFFETFEPQGPMATAILRDLNDELDKLTGKAEEAGSAIKEEWQGPLESINKTFLETFDLMTFIATKTEEQIEINNELFTTEEDITLMLMERQQERMILTSRALNGIEQVSEAEKESFEEFKKIQNEKIALAQKFGSMSISLIGAIASIGTAEDKAELQRMKDAGASEEELDEKRKQIAHDQAIRTRNLAILSATVNTASAIIGMLANPGGLAGVALSIFAGATGLAQIAAATAAPIPSLATGGQFITDGPTLIGDNASGQERVTVEPLGGGGDRGGSSRETFRLIGPGNELLGFIQRVGINGGKLHSFKGGRI